MENLKYSELSQRSIMEQDQPVLYFRNELTKIFTSKSGYLCLSKNYKLMDGFGSSYCKSEQILLSQKYSICMITLESV